MLFQGRLTSFNHGVLFILLNQVSPEMLSLSTTDHWDPLNKIKAIIGDIW